MTTENTGPEDSRDHSNRLVRAKTYKHGWNSDLQALSKFVKEQVFYVVVHDFKNESDDPLARCQSRSDLPKSVLETVSSKGD